MLYFPPAGHAAPGAGKLVKVNPILVKSVDDFVRGGKLGRNPSDWKSLNHNPFLNAIVLIVSKSAYGSRILQVEVNLITYKNYT